WTCARLDAATANDAAITRTARTCLMGQPRGRGVRAPSRLPERRPALQHLPLQPPSIETLSTYGDGLAFAAAIGFCTGQPADCVKCGFWASAAPGGAPPPPPAGGAG